AIALVVGASWSVAALSASDAAALVFVVWVWWTIARADASATARIARAEDASRVAAEAGLVAAGFPSLPAVGFTLGQANDALAPARGLLIGLAVGSVALAWISVHIDFGGEAPDYLDFAYLGLTIGMTFQVSDTGLTTKRLRRALLHHALLSYVFGTFVV